MWHLQAGSQGLTFLRQLVRRIEIYQSCFFLFPAQSVAHADSRVVRGASFCEEFWAKEAFISWISCRFCTTRRPRRLPFGLEIAYPVSLGNKPDPILVLPNLPYDSCARPFKDLQGVMHVT